MRDFIRVTGAKTELEHRPPSAINVPAPPQSGASSISSESARLPGRGWSVSLEHSIKKPQAFPPTQDDCLSCQEQFTVYPWACITCASTLAGVDFLGETVWHWRPQWVENLPYKLPRGDPYLPDKPPPTSPPIPDCEGWLWGRP